MTSPAPEADLLRLVAAVVRGDWARIEALRRSREPGPLTASWREAVLQTQLFAGFPRVVEALGVLARAGELGSPTPEECEDHRDLEAGRRLFETIYGDRTAAVRETLRALHPRLAGWIAEHAYGTVLVRPGATAIERELWAVAALVALDQPRQLMSHARGALRCGATAADLEAVLEALRGELDGGVVERAGRVVAQVTTSPD